MEEYITKIKKYRKFWLILSLLGIILCGIGLFYFQTIEPNSIIYNVNFETEGQTIDAVVYEPKIGPYYDRDSDLRPLVVISHGFAMSKDMMLSVGIELARRGISFISISLPGHGLSDPPYQFTNISYIAVSNAIDFMIENAHFSIDTEKIGVIGHSMGGMTAIKAAYSDDRIISTVAIAAPCGASQGLLSKRNTLYNLYFNEESMADYVNLSIPKNLFFALGENDEAVYYGDAQVIMGAATGLEIGEVLTDGTLYNEDFISGTSRKLKIYPFMEHATESFDIRSVSDITDWIGLSFLLDLDEFNSNLGYTSMIRPAFAIIGTICSFMLILPISSYMSSFILKQPRDLEQRIKDSDNDTIEITQNENKNELTQSFKVIASYFCILGVIPGLVGLLIPNSLKKWDIGGSLLTDAPLPIFLQSGLFGILFLLLIFKKKYTPRDFKTIFRLPVIKDEKKNKLINFTIYLAISIIPSLLLVQSFVSFGIFYLWISPYRVKSFILSLLLLIPICLVYSITRKILFIQLRNKLGFSKAKNILPIISGLLFGATIGFALSLSINSPFESTFIKSIQFWVPLMSLIAIILDFTLARWLLHTDGTVYSNTILYMTIIAVLMNVAFPVV